MSHGGQEAALLPSTGAPGVLTSHALEGGPVAATHPGTGTSCRSPCQVLGPPCRKTCSGCSQCPARRSFFPPGLEKRPEQRPEIWPTTPLATSGLPFTCRAFPRPTPGRDPAGGPPSGPGCAGPAPSALGPRPWACLSKSARQQSLLGFSALLGPRLVPTSGCALHPFGYSCTRSGAKTQVTPPQFL